MPGKGTSCNIRLDEMRQNLEQCQREEIDKINCQRADLQNICVKVQSDAYQMAAKESALEVRWAAFQERKERLHRFWESRENVVEGKQMVLECVWRAKEAKLNDERRELGKRSR